MSFLSFFKRKKQDEFAFPTNPFTDPLQKVDTSKQDFSQPTQTFPSQSSFSPSTYTQPSLSPPSFEPPSFSPPSQSAFQPSSFSNMQTYAGEKDLRKDIELLSSKLDTIKALLDAINQRLTTLERSVQEKEKKETLRW